MSQRMILAILVPILAIAIIASFAGSLGVIFMILEHQMHSEIGVIVLGVALVVGVPVVAYLLDRAVGEPQ